MKKLIFMHVSHTDLLLGAPLAQWVKRWPTDPVDQV